MELCKSLESHWNIMFNKDLYLNSFWFYWTLRKGVACDAVRGNHCAALAALGALLLLLMASFAPLAPPALPPRENCTQPPDISPATPLAQVAPPSTSQASTAMPIPVPLLTRDVYVAGHEQPHAELCPALGARLRLVVLVSSAPENATARDAVRLTWGHYAARSDVALAFVLGAPPPALRAKLDTEDALYSDLIVGHFVDSYSNLTLKTLSMLEWVDTYCWRAPRLLKTDDDMFINVPRLLKFAAAPRRANATRTIWGKVMQRNQPKRNTDSRYFVSPMQFPAKVFPDFVTGGAYLVTADAVSALLAAAPAERYLPLEDVFVTGVLAERLRVRRVHVPAFYNRKVAASPCTVQRGFAIHKVLYHEQFDLWRMLLNGKTKCDS